MRWRTFHMGEMWTLEFVHYSVIHSPLSDYIGRIKLSTNFPAAYFTLFHALAEYFFMVLLPFRAPLRNTHLIEKSFTNGSPKSFVENNRITNLKFYTVLPISVHIYFFHVRTLPFAIESITFSIFLLVFLLGRCARSVLPVSAFFVRRLIGQKGTGWLAFV